MKQQPIQHPFRIGIWGHYHGGNLGDEVIVASLIQNIRSHCPGAEIFGVSLDPQDTSVRHGIPAVSMANGTPYENGRSLELAENEGAVFVLLAKRLEQVDQPIIQKVGRKVRSFARVVQVWEAFRGADMLIVAGSGPLFDGWTGAWMHPFNLFKWALLARSTRTKFVPLSVGAGPIEAPLSKFFLRSALRTAYYRSYRDPHSAALIESIGLDGRNPVFPDLGFSLAEEEIAPHRDTAMASRGSGVIGISTVAHQDPRYKPHSDPARYRAYLEKLEAFSSWLLEEGYTLLLLRSQVTADDRVATDLKERLKVRGFNLDGRIITEPTRTYQDLLGQMARCEMVVGGRFHCHVLPFLLGKPVLGMAYHAKTFDLMEYMGQSEYCLSIDAMTVSLTIECFKKLRERSEAVTNTIEERAAACRRALDFQYRSLFNGSSTRFHRSYLPTPEVGSFQRVASLSH